MKGIKRKNDIKIRFIFIGTKLNNNFFPFALLINFLNY